MRSTETAHASVNCTIPHRLPGVDHEPHRNSRSGSEEYHQLVRLELEGFGGDDEMA